MKSQNKLILSYLRKGGTLDPMNTFKMFNSMNLRSRICAIEGKSHRLMLAKGESIQRIPMYNKETGKRYKAFRLVKVGHAKQKA